MIDHFWSVARCSIQLSYGRIVNSTIALKAIAPDDPCLPAGRYPIDLRAQTAYSQKIAGINY